MTIQLPGTPDGSVPPAVYDAFAGLQDWRGLRRQRRRVGAAASGVVLEVGVGTGRNLPHYTRASRVDAIDPDPSMLERAAARADRVDCPVDLHVAGGEDLPFASAHFDTVVITLTLCTIGAPDTALSEARRVLKPRGRLVFLEHERSPRGSIARLQDLATPAWSTLTGGCHLNRPTVATIRRQGFEITHLWRSRSGNGSLVQGTATTARARP